MADIRGPTFIRGDIAYGNEKMMEGAETRKLQYLFKVRQTPGVGQLIGRLASKGGKTPVAERWARLGGCGKPVAFAGLDPGAAGDRAAQEVGRDSPAEADARAAAGIARTVAGAGGGRVVRACGVGDVLGAVAQAYRDRADAENMFSMR